MHKHKFRRKRLDGIVGLYWYTCYCGKGTLRRR